jgi:hypothetical protein
MKPFAQLIYANKETGEEKTQPLHLNSVFLKNFRKYWFMSAIEKNKL